MAESTFKQTGLTEMKAAVNGFPAAVTAALRGVAEATAVRMQGRARVILLAKLKTSRHALADNITIKEDAANKQMQVESKPPSGQPGNVTLWNEYGTSKMPNRAYMNPAARGEEAQYRRDMTQASETVARNTFER